MNRTSFKFFYYRVKSSYAARDNEVQTAVWRLISEKFNSPRKFECLLDQVKEYIKIDIQHGGEHIDCKFGDGDSENLLGNSLKGNSSAKKSAAFHYYFQCKKEHLNLANEINTLIFDASNIDNEFEFPFVDIEDNEDVVSEPSAPIFIPPYISEKTVKERLEMADGFDDGIWLDPHNHCSIPLWGRDEELMELNDFIDQPDPFLICALVAPSGAGKTRLISEWMKSYVYSTEWDAGIVKNRNASVWEDWTPSRNTLIVIDYTYNYDEVVKTVIESSQNQDQYMVRLLVIDHVFPKKMFDDITWQKSAPSKSEADLLQNRYFFKRSPIKLEGEKPDSDLLLHVIASAASIDAQKYSKDDVEVKAAAAALHQMGKKNQNPDAVHHPLFAALMGQALRKNQGFANWSREDLLDYYFTSTDRLPWKSNDTQNASLGLWVGAYVGAATLRRGTALTTLRSCIDLERKNITSQQATRIEQLAERIVSSKDILHLKPFEPDILGENFFLKFLGELSGREDLRNSFIVMLNVADDTQSEEESITNILETLQRLTRNLVNDDQDSEYVKIQWKSLANFLNPESFSEYPLLRSAVSIALADIVRQLRLKDLSEVGEKFHKLISTKDVEKSSSSFLYLVASITLIHHFEWALEDKKEVNGLVHSLNSSFELLEKKSQGRWNGFTLSVYLGALNTVRYLAEILAVNPNDTPTNGRPALELASGDAASIDMVLLLIKIGVTTKIGLSDRGTPPIMVASSDGYLDIARTLLDHGADVDQVSPKNHATALMAASQNGHIATVELLLERGANINKETRDDGRTALILASLLGQAEMIKLLLSRGAKINHYKTDNASTALTLASQNGHVAAVKVLLENGADVHQKTKPHGGTALGFAATHRSIKLMKLLINYGADVNYTKIDCGSTMLMFACQSGYLDVVDILLSAKANTKIARNDGITALMVAATHSDETIITRLLAHADVDINQITPKEGATAFLIACQRGNQEIVELFYSTEKININHQMNDGFTALMLAVKNNHKNVVEYLVDQPEININLTDSEIGASAFILSCFLNNEEIARVFLKNEKTDLNLITNDELTPLLASCHVDALSIVKEILKSETVNVNYQCSDDGQTALLVASEKNNESIVEEILSRKDVDVNQMLRDNGRSALLVACHKGHLKIVNLLLQANDIRINLKTTDINATGMLFACQNGHFDIARALLKTGQIDVNEATSDIGCTALIIASQNGYLNIVSLLLSEADIDPDKALLSNGMTPLVLACKNNYSDIVKLLIEAGAKVNLTDCNGATALILASQNGHDAMIRILLANGADVNRADKNGMTAVFYAAKNKHIRNLLIEWGAHIYRPLWNIWKLSFKRLGKRLTSRQGKDSKNSQISKN